MQTLSNDFTQVGTDCGNEDIVACRSDLETVITDSTSMQKVLNQNAPPTCLKTVDTQVRAGLIDYKNGAYLAVQGIDDLDTSELTAGNQEMQNGDTAFTQAATDINKAQC